METRCTCGAGHLTFAACVRSKNLHVAYCRSAKNWDYSKAKANNSELDAYEAARLQGIKPAATTTAAIEFAVRRSDEVGRAFNAEIPGGF